jgi:hypothetical protein
VSLGLFVATNLLATSQRRYAIKRSEGPMQSARTTNAYVGRAALGCPPGAARHLSCISRIELESIHFKLFLNRPTFPQLFSSRCDI